MASESTAAATLAGLVASTATNVNPTNATAGVTPYRSLDFGADEQRDLGDIGEDLPFAGVAQPIGGPDIENTPLGGVFTPQSTIARTSMPQTASHSDEVERFLPKNPVSYVTSAMGTKLTRKGNFSACQCRFASAMRTLGSPFPLSLCCTRCSWCPTNSQRVGHHEVPARSTAQADAMLCGAAQPSVATTAVTWKRMLRAPPSAACFPPAGARVNAMLPCACRRLKESSMWLCTVEHNRQAADAMIGRPAANRTIVLVFVSIQECPQDVLTFHCACATLRLTWGARLSLLPCASCTACRCFYIACCVRM